MKRKSNTSPGSMAACLVREFLKSEGLRLAFLADSLGVCTATVSKWMTGVKPIPAERRHQIAALTGVDVSAWKDPPFKFKGNEKTYHRERARVRREAVILVMGPCSECGSEDELEIHHVDPLQKISHTIWSWSPPRMRAELKKCRVLCTPCHKKEHKILRQQLGCRGNV